jgi:glycosyltransferase involved in cell wall biosynthesis
MIIHYAPSGFSSEVVTLDDPSSPFLAGLPFRIHAMGTSPKSRYSPRLLPWLRANRDRFDGVMLHGLWEFTGIATLLSIAGHKPYVVFPHGMLDPYFKRAFPAKHLKKWAFWLLFEYWNLRRANRVLFTTSAERDLAAHSFWLHRWRPMVVALGSERPPLDAPTAASAFLERCPALRGQRFLLFLGRIDPKKGCDLLLDAFASFAATDPGLHLVMAGPDPAAWGHQLRTRLESSGAAARVHWPGMLKGAAKWGAFTACEAFILPSHQENFGIAVVEALACGRPVLVSDQINIAPDLAQDGCALMEPDTPAGTLRLLQRWHASDPEQRDAMSAQALTSFERRYNMQRNTAAILGVFHELSGPSAEPLAEVH